MRCPGDGSQTQHSEPGPAAPQRGSLLCSRVVILILERVGCCWQLQDEVASLLHVSFFPSILGGTRE